MVVADAVAAGIGIVEIGGHTVSAGTIGGWLFGAPFYAVLGDPQAFSLGPGAVGASVITALGVLWMFLALYRLVAPAIATSAAAVYAFGLPTWSVSADGLWTHTLTQTAIAGAALAAARSNLALAGLAIGIGAFGRAHLLVVAAVLGIGLALSRRDWRPVVQVGAGSSLGLALLIALNAAVYGTPSIGGGRADPLTRLELGIDVRGIGYLENVAGFLVSPGRGVLVFTPLLIVLLPSVIRAWRRAPDWTRWLAIGGVTFAAMQAWIAHFFGGDTYSAYRLGLEMVTCLVPLYAFAVARATVTTKSVAAAVAVLQVGVITIGAMLQPWIVQGQEWTNSEVLVLARGVPVIALVWFGLIGLLALGAFRTVRRQVVSQRTATPARIHPA